MKRIINNKNLIAKFVAERNEALFSLDKNKIMAFAKKYNTSIAKEGVSDEVFWASVYKAIYNIATAPPELKRVAIRWLRQHGFTTEVL